MAAAEDAIQNASNTRSALNEAVRAIGELMDFISSMDLDYIWIKSHRELAVTLTDESADETSTAIWSMVDSILDLHDRSESLDDASFEKEFETAVQPFHQDQPGKSLPNEHYWEKLLIGSIAFAQGWSKGVDEDG